MNWSDVLKAVIPQVVVAVVAKAALPVSLLWSGNHENSTHR